MAKSEYISAVKSKEQASRESKAMLGKRVFGSWNRLSPRLFKALDCKRLAARAFFSRTSLGTLSGTYAELERRERGGHRQDQHQFQLLSKENPMKCLPVLFAALLVTGCSVRVAHQSEDQNHTEISSDVE